MEALEKVATDLLRTTYQREADKPDGYVYMFFDEKSSQPCYIGRTANITQRMKQHFCGNHLGSPTKLTNDAYDSIIEVQIARVGNGRDAVWAEESLIYQYKPKYNTLIPRRETYHHDRFEYKWFSLTPSEFVRNPDVIRLWSDSIPVDKDKEIFALKQENSQKEKDILRFREYCWNAEEEANKLKEENEQLRKKLSIAETIIKTFEMQIKSFWRE